MKPGQYEEVSSSVIRHHREQTCSWRGIDCRFSMCDLGNTFGISLDYSIEENMSKCITITASITRSSPGCHHAAVG